MLGAVSLLAFRLAIERANVRRKPRARYLVVVFTLGLRILLGVVIALALTQFVLRQRVRRLIAQEHARPARTKPEAPIERQRLAELDPAQALAKLRATADSAAKIDS
ncbi:MAG: hypothetical protein DWH97_08250 [Planctomycetota bacterium]|nr:MAG: hypothetical protein DWH97_08250 [Planctomycetota bacterium]RLS96872.1 MAG: hypothetical protein DWI12_00085 [Planctomycetota bacterium]